MICPSEKIFHFFLASYYFLFVTLYQQNETIMTTLNKLCETFGNHYGYNFFLLQTDTSKESYIEMLIDNGFSPDEIHERLTKES